MFGKKSVSEALEVQGKAKIVSSGLYELTPSDGTLDVSGNINATGSINLNNVTVGGSEVITPERYVRTADGKL